jgi:hypothetical protein
MREQDFHEIDAVCPIHSTAETAIRQLAVSPGLAWAAFIDSEPVTIFGAAHIPDFIPHQASGWAYGTRRMKRTIPAVTRHCLNVLQPMLIERGVHRMEVRSYMGHDLPHGWLRGMGYQMEGIARRYGRRGEDFAIYAKTIEPRSL